MPLDIEHLLHSFIRGIPDSPTRDRVKLVLVKLTSLLAYPSCLIGSLCFAATFAFVFIDDGMSPDEPILKGAVAAIFIISAVVCYFLSRRWACAGRCFSGTSIVMLVIIFAISVLTGCTSPEADKPTYSIEEMEAMSANAENLKQLVKKLTDTKLQICDTKEAINAYKDDILMMETVLSTTDRHLDNLKSGLVNLESILTQLERKSSGLTLDINDIVNKYPYSGGILSHILQDSVIAPKCRTLAASVQPWNLPSPDPSASSPENDNVPRRTKATIRETMFFLLSPDDHLDENFGLYSYVLIRGINPENDTKVRNLIDNIFHLRLTARTDVGRRSNLEKNILLALVKGPVREETVDWVLSNYDVERVRAIVRDVNEKFGNPITRRQKILIITLPKPIDAIELSDKILITNFSRIPDSHVNAYFDAFLDSVGNKNFPQKDALEELEVKMLNLMRSFGVTWEIASDIFKSTKAYAGQK